MWIARVFIWVLLAMVLLACTEVFSRYVLNRPTVWIWDVNVQIMGAVAILGSAFALLRGKHVTVDILLTNFSPKKRAKLWLISSPFLFSAIGAMLWIAIREAYTSVQLRETIVSVWAEPLYPFKIVILIGFFMMLLQGIVSFIRALNTVMHS